MCTAGLARRWERYGASDSQLADIQALDRFQEIPTEGPLCDLLWSDPYDDITMSVCKTPDDWDYWFSLEFDRYVPAYFSGTLREVFPTFMATKQSTLS